MKRKDWAILSQFVMSHSKDGVTLHDDNKLATMFHKEHGIHAPKSSVAATRKIFGLKGVRKNRVVKSGSVITKVSLLRRIEALEKALEVMDISHAAVNSN